MSLRYRDSSGNETIVSGLTPGGDIEAGASAIRHATVSLPALAAGAYGEVNATFSDGDMPDTDYVILVDSIGTTARNFSFSDKTISGFKVTHANISDNTSGAQTLKLIAWKIYSVQHAAETAASVETLESMIPTGAGSSNKLTTQTYVDNADTALDGRLDNIEDVIPTGTAVTNQLVNKSELQTAIDNVEIDVDDQIDSTSTNPVENQVIAAALNKKQDKIFVGTTAEWDALSAQEKAQYNLVSLTNDSATCDVVDAVTDGVMKPVTSNAVYDAITKSTVEIIATSSSTGTYGSQLLELMTTYNNLSKNDKLRSAIIENDAWINPQVDYRCAKNTGTWSTPYGSSSGVDSKMYRVTNATTAIVMNTRIRTSGSQTSIELNNLTNESHSDTLKLALLHY